MEHEKRSYLRHAMPAVRQWARENRQEAAEAEAMLWEALRNRRLCETKFRRQHPVNRFILDFWCPAHRLVIELDGGYHDGLEQATRDAAREQWVRRHGVRVLRFGNEDVLTGLPAVLERIAQALAPQTPLSPKSD